MFTPEAMTSWVIFAPTIAALLLVFCDKKAEEAMKFIMLGGTIVTFFLTLALAGTYNFADPGMQAVVKLDWVKSWNIYYQTGFDGISLPLVLLTSFVSMLSAAACGVSISRSRVTAFCSCCWKPGCWACSCRSTSSCFTSFGK